MRTWTCTGLILAILAKWLSGRVFANDFLELCAENEEACEQLLTGTDSLKLCFNEYVTIVKITQHSSSLT